MRKITKSLEWLSRAERVIPLQSQTFSKAPDTYVKGVYPVYLKHGEGCYVWDVDYNPYIDYICGLGPITLGYSYPVVNDAITTQLMDGITFSLPNVLEVELSELLVDIIPSAEMVRFAKTGSEAAQAAVRAARAFTGREKVAFRGYHGWHSEFSVATERPKGIPRAFKDYIIPFEYNNIESLEKVFNDNKCEIAAVIMEPMIIEEPKGHFLEKVQQIAHKNGAVFILDEIVTGFRWSLGGAQEYFGVTPDMSIFGKGIANGMPLSAVVGKKEIMREFEDVFFSGTFSGECLSLAAGLATIKEMRYKRTIDFCWQTGRHLIGRVASIGIPTIGLPCRPMLVIDSRIKNLFLQETVKRGVLLHPGLVLNICYSHTVKDINETVRIFKEALDICNKALEQGNVEDMMEGLAPKEPFKRL